MSHPDYIVKPEEITSVLGVEPVYPLTAGITNKMLNKLMKQALAAVPPLPEWQDEPYLKATGWPSFNQALKLAHHPVKLTDLEPSDPARSRLAYDELLANQLALAIVRERVKSSRAGKSTATVCCAKKF